MATIIDQVTLRTGVADWLNRSDLTDAQIDNFVSIGEARIYEDLRVPTLEISQGFSVTASNSSIIVPEGFLEMIELKKDDATDKDKDVVLSRVDSKVFNNNKIKHAYTRHIGNFLLTDENGEQKANGNYGMYYYKAEDAIGTYATATTAAGAFVVGSYYKIAVAGNTTWTNHGAANNNVGTIFKATSQVTGTGTAQIELIPYILSDVFEVILYAACTAASVYLGDIEMEQKFDALTDGKITALNQKEIRASMKGAAFSARFSTPLL
tara:strand:+ start:1129 stop:1926 length:798 start_codon:yes stop_codon:yes gene_type:complete